MTMGTKLPAHGPPGNKHIQTIALSTPLSAASFTPIPFSMSQFYTEALNLHSETNFVNSVPALRGLAFEYSS